MFASFSALSVWDEEVSWEGDDGDSLRAHISLWGNTLCKESLLVALDLACVEEECHLAEADPRIHCVENGECNLRTRMDNSADPRIQRVKMASAICMTHANA